MNPILTVVVCMGAVVSEVVLCFAAGTDENTTRFFICWTGAPYLAHCALAFARRAYRPVIFAGTLISSGLASLLYWSGTWPMVSAKFRGEEVMTCAGPLIELGFPIVQWFVVLVLLVITRRGPAVAVA